MAWGSLASHRVIGPGLAALAQRCRSFLDKVDSPVFGEPPVFRCRLAFRRPAVQRAAQRVGWRQEPSRHRVARARSGPIRRVRARSRGPTRSTDGCGSRRLATSPASSSQARSASSRYIGAGGAACSTASLRGERGPCGWQPAVANGEAPHFQRSKRASEHLRKTSQCSLSNPSSRQVIL